VRGGFLSAVTIWLILALGDGLVEIDLPLLDPPSKRHSTAALARWRLAEQANVPQSGPGETYKLLRSFCIHDSRGKLCLAFISVDSTVFTHEGAVHLASLLEKRFRRRSRVKAFLFDNPNWAEAHARFKAELRDLERHIRGMYYLDRRKCEEYVKFSSSKDKPWNETTIVLHNLNCK